MLALSKASQHDVYVQTVKTNLAFSSEYELDNYAHLMHYDTSFKEYYHNVIHEWISQKIM